ncbi:MAG: DUF6076 domain-containing protein [Firmicutes bacterium]|nr:DUF6076 domain-containing protein [Bacillota bacterium]
MFFPNRIRQGIRPPVVNAELPACGPHRFHPTGCVAAPNSFLRTAIYFALTGHINTEYCDRPFDSTGRTCKEIGALRIWEKKKVENPALKAYSKAYKKGFAWIEYGKITKEAFYEWSEQAREMRELCLKGSIALEEFRTWLDGMCVRFLWGSKSTIP